MAFIQGKAYPNLKRALLLSRPVTGESVILNTELGGLGNLLRLFESGRSLVEMLGVLAVIGVLSVGAIAGYRRAIDSQKASATIAELNQYAFLASQQALQKRADLDLSEQITIPPLSWVHFNTNWLGS